MASNDPTTCPAREVFAGSWHQSDLSGAVVFPAEEARVYFDRRKLELAGWILQKPDALRGAPFSRALHPKAKGMEPEVYLVNHPGQGQRVDGPVVQVVYVPIGDSERTWVEQSWNTDLRRWYNDNSDGEGRFCCGVLFIKADA